MVPIVFGSLQVNNGFRCVVSYLYRKLRSREIDNTIRSTPGSGGRNSTSYPDSISLNFRSNTTVKIETVQVLEVREGSLTTSLCLFLVFQDTPETLLSSSGNFVGLNEPYLENVIEGWRTRTTEGSIK